MFQPPVIHNMASATSTINEGLVIETQLFAINVTDASAGDFVTCDIKSSTPAAGSTIFFIKYISGTSRKYMMFICYITFMDIRIRFKL